MEPAAYPPKNTEELQAVICFLNQLDLARVKPDARFLDKVPNLDGSLELVDEHQKTVGELKIQIKKIPHGSLQFDCPTELVGYSTRVSSPFLLVCVDVENRKAYWCHVSAVMPGLKPEQKTFTVRFQSVVDEIGTGFPYIERWRDLCQDYLRRVSEFPTLERKVGEEIGLNKLSAKDRRTFQEFIEEVNVLLDVDLPIVKHEYFADAWKLGVSIHRADAEAVAYSIYTIRNGENAPLLVHIPKASEQPKIITESGNTVDGVISFHLTGIGPEVSHEWTIRHGFHDPKATAREFVLRYLVQLVRGKRLHVHGRNQSVELLMWFARDYSHALGLPRVANYTVADISYGLNIFLPTWYSLSFPRVMKFFGEHYGAMLRFNPLPSFEQIANTALQHVHPPETEVREAIDSHLRRAPYPVRTNEFSFEGLSQAVEFLVATKVQEISRLDRPRTQLGQKAWGGYTGEELKHNIVAMLEGAAQDYPEFVKGNRFGRLESSLLLGQTAMVMAADPRTWHGSDFPTIHRYYVENADRNLPLLTFVDLEKEPNACALDGETNILRGVRRRCTSWGWSMLLNLTNNRPIQATLYDWLTDDLRERFGESFRP